MWCAGCGDLRDETDMAERVGESSRFQSFRIHMMHIPGYTERACNIVCKSAHVLDPGLSLSVGSRAPCAVLEDMPVRVRVYLNIFAGWPTTRVVVAPARACADPRVACESAPSLRS